MNNHPKYFAVKGKNAFPFHMLTRNECWPRTLADADQLWSGCATQHPEIALTLITYSGRVLGDEWAKAGWPVTGSTS